MALREVRINGDEILRKKSRIVNKIDDRITTIINDMVETMYHKDGVGLAAPQVGILKRIVVIDTREEEDSVLKLINPEIIEFRGTQKDEEGCLSVPNATGVVDRPEYVKVKALNENGDEIIVEGTKLLARALCHEIDHLDGVLFIDKIEK